VYHVIDRGIVVGDGCGEEVAGVPAISQERRACTHIDGIAEVDAVEGEQISPSREFVLR
jgi:hypothetical protein